MNWRLILLAAALIIISLSSCSEQKRCARYVKKHPECFKTDTVWQEKAIPGFEIDTTLKGKPPIKKTGADTCACISDSNSIDTFIVIQDNVKVQTITKWNDRIIKQNVLKRDTFVKYANVYTSFPVTTNKLSFWHKFAYGFMGLLILLLAIGRVRSK